MNSFEMNHGSLAVWAVTQGGVTLGEMVLKYCDTAVLLCSSGLVTNAPSERVKRFDALKPEVETAFFNFSGHLFIMATGITVRVIARLLFNKVSDPAVVVMDEKGDFCISLVSGHIGGANDLCKKIAGIVGGTPVITTATDVNRLPSIDTLAKEEGFYIENPGAIKRVNMAILRGDTIPFYDPYFLLDGKTGAMKKKPVFSRDAAAVIIDDKIGDHEKDALVLRPRSIVAGVGCNRDTGMDEIVSLIKTVFHERGLSLNCLYKIASIDIKADEKGLLDCAEALNAELEFFNKDQLNGVTGILNPSGVVQKYTGAKSVCEAAAILGSKQGKLIVQKTKSKNATLALAKKNSM
jgi:cobalt-precorrin 5A hydrolase